MASRSLGTLTLDLVAKIGGFVAGMDKAARESEKWRSKVKKDLETAGKAFGAFAAVAVGALGVWIKNSIDAADEASKAAAAAGIQIESLTGLQYAADLAGVANEELNSSLARFNKSIDQASRGSKLQAQAFEDIGISIRDASGEIKDVDSLLLEVSDKFSGYEDGAAKAALAQELFGRSGTKLIPLLNSGSAGILELTDQARRLGLVLDQETASAAEEFNDSLTVLGKVSSGVTNRIAADMLPVMNELTGLLVDLAVESEGAADAADILGGVLKGLATVGIVIGASFKATGEAIGSVAAALLQAARGDFQGAWDTLQTGATDYAETAEAAIVRINKLWSGDYRKAGEEAAETSERVRATLERSTVATEATTAATQAATSAVQSQVDALQLQADTLGLTSEETTLYKLALDGATAAQLDMARAALDQISAFNQANEALKERQELLSEVASIERETWSDASRALGEYQEKIETLRTALLAGEINQSQYDTIQAGLEANLEKSKETSDEMSEYSKSAARNIQSAFADFLFDPFEGGLEGMLKSFGTILQRMAAEAAAAQIFEAIGGFGKANSSAGGTTGFLASLASFFGGARAIGGPVAAGGIYEVGEYNMPELADIGGRQYLIPGNDGRITPIRGGSGAPSTMVNNISLPGVRNAREGREAAASVQRAIARGVADSARYT